ncbi:hypothetical protein BGZ94_001815 [Podila epigama]|nr:hypothetical protein BGZ94_001815 [Podila epigama]
MTFLNPRMMDFLQGHSHLLDLMVSDSDLGGYIEDDDPEVERILNGRNDDVDRTPRSNSVLASHWGMDVDEDESRWPELSLLESLDQSRQWTPTVPTPKEMIEAMNSAAERPLSRSQTLNTLSTAGKVGTRHSMSTLTRHRSEGGQSQKHDESGLDLQRRSLAARKGVGRAKSPSRAPQQALDLTTESLRRKLLGPGSVRKTVVTPSIPVGLKSPSRRKSTAHRRGILDLPMDELPDLTTMMMLKRKQNANLSSDSSSRDNNDNSFHSHSAMATHNISSVDDLTNTQPDSSHLLSTTLPSSRQEQDDKMDDTPNENANLGMGTSLEDALSNKAQKEATAATATKPHSANVSRNSFEARNKETIQNLTKSTLAKINIGVDHEDYEECVSNLHRSVMFAMRKDITSRAYHLEELERLMDRHAALL